MERIKAGGLSEDRSHRRYNRYSIAFKRQVAKEFVAGETLYGLAKRYNVSRNLIRLWVKRLQSGAFDGIVEYEAKIAALERLVGSQALEIESLKEALRNALRSRSATTSVITDPTAGTTSK